MPVKNPGTHQSHCCHTHGCKYGDEDCPVFTGSLKQESPCEWCADDVRAEMDPRIAYWLCRLTLDVVHTSSTRRDALAFLRNIVGIDKAEARRIVEEGEPR